MSYFERIFSRSCVQNWAALCLCNNSLKECRSKVMTLTQLEGTLE